MVHLRGMVHEEWYIIQESKLWYNYIIMVRSDNAGPSVSTTLNSRKMNCSKAYVNKQVSRASNE